MMIYGGYSALLRGEPFPRAPRDIDVFGTPDDRAALLMHLRDVLPWNITPVPWDAHPERVIIRHPSYQAPSWWRTIEFETVSPEFLVMMANLPGVATAEVGGFVSCRSSLNVDMLIKLAAIEVVPNVNPKHQADIDQFDWSAANCSADEMVFFAAFKGILINRYGRIEA